MKIIRFKNREALLRNRKNKGAVSAEYILVAVLVALVCMFGLKTFGGVLLDRLNKSATAMGNVTNDPAAAQQDPMGKVEGLGNGSTPGPSK
jgi:Flp pilus assembly pilin Flp